jgi:hypothetical protein
MWRDRKMPLLRRWSARWAENPEVLVRFQRVARSRRKSRAVRHFSIKEAIPSLDPRRVRATSFGAYKQPGSTPGSGATFCYGRRCSTVGHLNLDQATTDTNTRRARAASVTCLQAKWVRLPPSPQFWIASTIGQCTRLLTGEVRVRVPGDPRMIEV